MAAGVVIAALWGSALPAQAQTSRTGRYYPFDQTLPPGVGAQMAAAGRRDLTCALQPIRVELPGSGGRVSFYVSCDGALNELNSPALAAVQIGAVYRLRLDRLPDFPGLELYPTVELIDRLHPPRGREAEFPVPVPFTEQELRAAAQGRLVTKVIYLEQPDRALPVDGSTAARTRLAGPRENILAAADEVGRPMAIVRLGGRTPDPRSPEPGFFGQGAAVQILSPQPAPEQEWQP